jgi:hypothetical protein
LLCDGTQIFEVRLACAFEKTGSPDVFQKFTICPSPKDIFWKVTICLLLKILMTTKEAKRKRTIKTNATLSSI